MQRTIKLGSTILLALAVLFTAVGVGHAATPLAQPVRQYYNLMTLIRNSASQWDAQLLSYATDLFWSLALIQLIWTFAPLVLKGADIGEIFGELLRFVLVIGFFYALMTISTVWASDVVNSFRQAAGVASHLGGTLQPQDVLGFAVKLASDVNNTTTWNPLVALGIGISAALILLCFAFVAAFMGITIIESYIVINASVFFLGFGGSQWTREYAMAMVRYAVSVGAKLFVLTLLVGLILQAGQAWQAAYQHNEASTWTLVGLSLIAAYFAKTIPEIVQGLITGTSVGGGMGIGAIGGAIAAAAVGAATGGIGAGVAGTAANAGAAGAASGLATSGVTGLAEGLASSVAGGGASPAPGFGSAVSGAGRSAGGPAASSISPRTAGGAQSARPAGVSTSSPTASAGSTAAQSPTSGGSPAAAASGSQPASAAASQTAEAGQGGGAPDSGDGSPAAAVGEVVGGAVPSPSSTTAPGKPSLGKDVARGAHLTAAASVKSLGVLSSIAVPGMESAHGLSLGPPPGQNQPQEQDTWSNLSSGPSLPEGVITPASGPAATPPEGPQTPA